jgi:hypothetical protein
MDFGRVARRFWPGRSAPARLSDWIEAGCLLVLVLLMMVAVPVAGAVGSEVYTTTSQLAQQQRADRMPTTATLLDPAPAIEPGVLGELVRASWVRPDGQVAVGKVSVRQEAAAGDRVDIWVDRSGEATLATGFADGRRTGPECAPSGRPDRNDAGGRRWRTRIEETPSSE